MEKVSGPGHDYYFVCVTFKWFFLDDWLTQSLGNELEEFSYLRT